MKRSACGALAVLSVAVPAGCGASTGVSDAVVTEHDGRPCFGTGDAMQLQRLQAVIVSDLSKTPARTVWESTGARFENAARGCIAYGESLSGGADAGKAAPPLQPGQVYHVFLNLRRENAGDPTSGYEAEFCLKPQAGTQAVVHQVLWDKTLNRKSYEGCRAARQP